MAVVVTRMQEHFRQGRPAWEHFMPPPWPTAWYRPIICTRSERRGWLGWVSGAFRLRFTTLNGFEIRPSWESSRPCDRSRSTAYTMLISQLKHVLCALSHNYMAHIERSPARSCVLLEIVFWPSFGESLDYYSNQCCGDLKWALESPRSFASFELKKGQGIP